MSCTTVQLPYGKRQITFELPTSNLLGVFYPKVDTEARDEDQLIREALAHPIDALRLCDLAHRGQNVAIVISDMTRPCPSHRLLPHILNELESAGITDEKILIVAAIGSHRRMTEAELVSAVGPAIASRIRVVNHDVSNTVRLATTSVGTPVEIFRPLTEVDLRICIGNIESHYFAGFTGGSKAILPGCASLATITANHAMMLHTEATVGRIEGNPVRADLEEGAALLGVDFILNVALDPNHRIVEAVAGAAIAAHRRGCKWIKQHGMIPIPKRADIVLASAGGYPKDINLYQAHKGLNNACHFVQEGGAIFLVAECKEGFGNPIFEEWMTEGSAPKDWIARIQRQFVLGGHKAAAIATVLEKAKVYLLSDLPPDVISRCGIVPMKDPKEVLKTAFREFGRQAEILVLPQACSILPIISS
ncbi:MAG: nickel-dependent lactate racemase [Anaerolineales bacterium]|nr:MAG: nickel-dependent lactate racemase [Anaerolineales bacterium]